MSSGWGFARKVHGVFVRGLCLASMANVRVLVVKGQVLELSFF
jgi:hypothetical protein